MAFPSITPRQVSADIAQTRGESLSTVVNGAPWVRRQFSARKHAITVDYVLTTAEWNTLIVHYEATYNSSFSWTDPRTAGAITVYYDGRPQQRQSADGVVLQSTEVLAIVDLMEV